MSRKAVVVAAAVTMVSACGRSEDLRCTIHASKTARKQELTAMARIPEQAARNTALASLKVPDGKATVKESELEVEAGCLVYSFDIGVAGEKGVREVLIDAGDGKVLKTTREDAAAEAKEKAQKDKRP